MKEHPLKKWHNFDLLAENVPDFRLVDYTLVQEFVIRYGRDRHDGMTCTVELQLCKDYGISPVVIVRFFDVSGLKIIETHQISGLAVLDARDLQWDRARFKVTDYEGGAIEFYCHDLELDWKEWR